MSRQLLKVLVVEDSVPIRDRMTRLVESIPGVRVCGHADTLQDAVDGIDTLRPDVVLLDLALRSGNGFDVLEWLRGRPRKPVVIALTNYSNPLFREKSLEMGAEYFFDKSTEFELAVAVVAKLVQPDGAQSTAPRGPLTVGR